MPRYDEPSRERTVNLALNEDLVDEARKLTDNLSAVVESLLALKSNAAELLEAIARLEGRR